MAKQKDNVHETLIPGWY